ncbi:MAG: hypothetical protein CMO55_02460 [Verrucomicrobiales bacterium]|nr:hypothetical protein [Verrucomicrobiales bacterium]
MADPESIFIEHDGHSIACLIHENENASLPPVVLVHGLTASFRFWEDDMFSSLLKDRSWYSVSLPLHAPSTYRQGFRRFNVSEDKMAELLRVPIDHLIPKGDFHLLGHSLGGFAALNCASKFPDRIASVVAIGSFMNARAKGLEKVIQFFSKGFLVRKIAFYVGYRILKIHWRVFATASVFYSNRKFSLLRNPDFIETVKRVFPDVKNHPIRGQRLLIQSLIKMDLFDEAHEIQCPVLMMIGMKDPVIPPEHQIRSAELLGSVTIARFEKSGHLIFGERPKEFTETLSNWLEKF